MLLLSLSFLLSLKGNTLILSLSSCKSHHISCLRNFLSYFLSPQFFLPRRYSYIISVQLFHCVKICRPDADDDDGNRKTRGLNNSLSRLRHVGNNAICSGKRYHGLLFFSRFVCRHGRHGYVTACLASCQVCRFSGRPTLSFTYDR